MTEGIIQQWFNELPDYEITQYDINKLIEKIKQESFDIEFKTYEYRPVIRKGFVFVFTSKLIGDNK